MFLHFKATCKLLVTMYLHYPTPCSSHFYLFPPFSCHICLTFSLSVKSEHLFISLFAPFDLSILNIYPHRFRANGYYCLIVSMQRLSVLLQWTLNTWSMKAAGFLLQKTRVSKLPIHKDVCITSSRFSLMISSLVNIFRLSSILSNSSRNIYQ